MMLKYTLLLPLLFAIKSLTFGQGIALKPVGIDTMTVIDHARNRQIPIAVYTPNKNIKGRPIPVILSPGYPGKNTDYGYIARNLQSKGYLVVTVQHDLPGDKPIPTGENLFQRRLPHWQRGVANILFVLEKIKKVHPDLDYKKLVLIGHSNGGDISMLLANKYPELVNKVISLDNRRVPFPRLTHPRILSIRSKDQPADSGVIPSGTEILKYRMKVVNAAILHNDMGGTAPQAELDTINLLIEDFLNASQFSELRSRMPILLYIK